MKVPIYNQEGKEIKKIEIPKEVFGVEMNHDLVHQIVVSQMANKRQGSAHTKQRDEVRGGGKKPWRQKGTGRARHGSTRSPIWKGGGVTFGPRNEKNWKKIIPKKMRRKALFMVLSEKLKDNEIIFIDKIELKDHKTKTFQKIIGCFPVESGKVLIAISKPDKKILLGTKNIPKVETIMAKDINIIKLLSSKFLIFTEESIKIIEKTFVSQK